MRCSRDRFHKSLLHLHQHNLFRSALSTPRFWTNQRRFLSPHLHTPSKRGGATSAVSKNLFFLYRMDSFQLGLRADNTLFLSTYHCSNLTISSVKTVFINSNFIVSVLRSTISRIITCIHKIKNLQNYFIS